MRLNLEGSEFEDYNIIKRIADGAYTEVYLATAANGRKVIVKALNPRLKKDDAITDEQLLWHFQNEIEALEKVRHPHVVELLKYGESTNSAGDKFRYLITEYMSGGTLKDYCRSSGMTLQQVIKLFGPVCEALSLIHLNGIIHCDIKPSNLLLDRDADPTCIKLADFGVSKVIKDGVTQDRIPVGTSPYAAPEHHPDATDEERLQPLDARADIYALAMTILHALLGTKPEFQRSQITNLPPHPVYREFKHEVERVLGRATAIQVERRYQSVNDFWQEFKLVGSSVSEYDETVVRARRSRMVVRIERSLLEPHHRTELISLPEGATIEIVQIPDGSFNRGTTAEEIEQWVSSFPEYLQRQVRTWLSWETPVRSVTVKSFWMGKYPVTQKQWRAVSANLPPESYDLPANPWDKRPGTNIRNDEYPVTNVSWLEAYEFCARLSIDIGKDIRLPSEAEWEYACRAGTTTPFNFPHYEAIDTEMINYNGAIPDRINPHIWRSDKGISGVGQFGGPNEFGLFDMHGNVWEWCADAWHDSYKKAPTDGSPSDNSNELLRVARGGSWASFLSLCRSASRARFLYNEYFDDLGFRIVI
jgi:formylglycine-generating enzyme required for sulfatase activity/tRNA A-37 threonylcarbamoyl transferase component Bud32